MVVLKMTNKKRLKLLIIKVINYTKHKYPDCDETNCAKCLAEKFNKELDEELPIS